MKNLPHLRTLGLALAVASMAGCAGHWHHPVEADGTYCHRLGTLRTSTCTPQPVPSDQADLDAKAFAADREALTVYVVRAHWADGRHIVPFTVDGGSPVQTVPDSFVRLRLPPGSHRLALTWEGQAAARSVEGQAGDVRFIQLVGHTRASGSTFQWSADDEADGRLRAMKARLVADFAPR